MRRQELFKDLSIGDEFLNDHGCRFRKTGERECLVVSGGHEGKVFEGDDIRLKWRVALVRKVA